MKMDISSQIAQARSSAERSSAALLKTFAFVPDDKLGWAPSDSSRSSLWILGHCGGANRAFARGIRGEAFPDMDVAEFGTMVWNEGKDTATREEAIRLVEESTAEVIAALDGLTEEGFAKPVGTPFGPLPMAIWMSISGDHMNGHAHQVEYLQTIWGDHVNHMM